MVSLKIAYDEHIKGEEELVKENDELKQEIVEINMRHIEEINNIRLVRALCVYDTHNMQSLIDVNISRGGFCYLCCTGTRQSNKRAER